METEELNGPSHSSDDIYGLEPPLEPSEETEHDIYGLEPLLEPSEGTEPVDSDGLTEESPQGRDNLVAETVETYEWIKKSDGLTAAYEHPKHGRVLVVAYVETVHKGVVCRFNGEVNGDGLLQVAALGEFERRRGGSRLIVKLVPWKEGTSVRRWGTLNPSGQNDLRYQRRFIIKGQELVRR